MIATYDALVTMVPERPAYQKLAGGAELRTPPLQGLASFHLLEYQEKGLGSFLSQDLLFCITCAE